MRKQQRQMRGFTLIEVMIVVAIIAILAAIALPSYRDYVLRSKIADATSALETMRTDMERYFQDRRTFASTGNYTSPCLTTRSLDAFDVACAAADVTANTYKITATGKGIASGFAYTINEINARFTPQAGAGYNTCTGNVNGWMIRRGQSC